jgi:hypothetical protein
MMMTTDPQIMVCSQPLCFGMNLIHFPTNHARHKTSVCRSGNQRDALQALNSVFRDGRISFYGPDTNYSASF